ncbi:tumor necrosis factor alpha-induced protein 2 [Cricetulus griseus]
MLKMVTFFQGLPGQQQSVLGTLDFPGSPQKSQSASEVESEASMSEASSEDMMPSQETGMAPDEEEEESTKKEKKKYKGLANMFSVFTKGKKKKKKNQPRSSDPEVQPKPRPELDGPPPTVEELKEALENGRLEAAWPVLALERELEAAAAAGGASVEELVRQQSKVEALYLLLRDQVLGVLRRPLEAAPERVSQALAVVSQQELEDRRAAGGPVAAVLAATRPRRWLQLWRGGVAEVAAERLEAQPGAVPEGRSEVENRFVHMGCTMKEDLEAVVERLKPLFPAEFNVVHTYAESYHHHFATHLCTLAQFELCERDTYLLLLWVHNFYPNEILNSPKLAKELEGIKLGSLLPPKQTRLLEAVFLSNEVTNVKLLMTRALELESQRWAQDVAPQSLDGHYHSELAIDIIQGSPATWLHQALPKLAEIIRLQDSSAIKIEVATYATLYPDFSYQRTFDEFLEKSKLLRNYRANVIANINNCLSFGTSMEQKWQIPQESLRHLLDPLKDLRAHGFDALLQGLFAELKPLFKKFTQTRWATPVETLEEIISTVDVSLPEFSELKDCFREELMEAVHLHLVKEYIIRLSKRRLVLKTEEQQQQLARHILTNADVIQHFCTQNC